MDEDRCYSRYHFESLGQDHHVGMLCMKFRLEPKPAELMYVPLMLALNTWLPKLARELKLKSQFL